MRCWLRFAVGNSFHCWCRRKVSRTGRNGRMTAVRTCLSVFTVERSAAGVTLLPGSGQPSTSPIAMTSVTSRARAAGQWRHPTPPSYRTRARGRGTRALRPGGVIPSFRARARARARARFACPSNHLHQHGNNAEQELATRFVPGVIDEPKSPGNVQDSGALGHRPPGHAVETSLLTGRELPGPFRDVQGHRGRRPLQLVGQITSSARQMFDDVVGQCNELDGRLVDVELLVVEDVHSLPRMPGTGSGTGSGTIQE